MYLRLHGHFDYFASRVSVKFHEKANYQVSTVAYSFNCAHDSLRFGENEKKHFSIDPLRI